MSAEEKKELLEEFSKYKFEVSARVPVWALSLIVGAGLSAFGCESKNSEDKKPPEKKSIMDSNSSMKKSMRPNDVPVYAGPPVDFSMKPPVAPMDKTMVVEPVNEYGAPIPLDIKSMSVPVTDKNKSMKSMSAPVPEYAAVIEPPPMRTTVVIPAYGVPPKPVDIKVMSPPVPEYAAVMKPVPMKITNDRPIYGIPPHKRKVPTVETID